MSNVPAEMKYEKSHEWLRREADGTVTVGITDHAQAALGDLVFVDVPAVGRVLAVNESCAVVESVKAASDVYAPIAGTVTAVNEALGSSPEILNSDPYGAGWMWKMKPADTAAIDKLLDAAGYEGFLKTL
ncbi:MAG: glycine cleavage system protein GcvH [Pseudomonadota bacterium]|nr:glycine cleavage system protein GcvH [Pseudomonadota bacterium]